MNKFLLLFICIAYACSSLSAAGKQILEEWPNKKAKRVFEGQMGNYLVIAGYFEDGKKRLIMKLEKKDSKNYLAKATSYNPDGSELCNIKDGNGELKVLFGNGQVEYVETYKNGRLEGETTYWWDNGVLSMTGSYKEGNKHGIWKVYDKEGEEEVVYYFIDGKEVKEQEWLENQNK
ncbi:MAG: hypothetical protein JXA60_03185 [Candidatus Coatesbacteria bacterium]|nr:hypothetical protein [Candidatus Coatesbacteria bacterium]